MTHFPHFTFTLYIHTSGEVGRNRPIGSRGEDRARNEREPLGLYVLRRVRWDGTVLLEAGEMTELTSRGHASLSEDRSMQERPMAPPVLSQSQANVPYDRPEQERPMAPHSYSPKQLTPHHTPHTTHSQHVTHTPHFTFTPHIHT